MKKILRPISYAALVMLIVPPLGVFAGKVTLDASKAWMLGATLVWFATAPFWMGKSEE